MRKTMEQIVLEGQAAKCESLEELYLVWQMMQQMEDEPYGSTCYGEIDQRSFHIDGVVSPEEFTGNLYILKDIYRNQSFYCKLHRKLAYLFGNLAFLQQMMKRMKQI